MMTLGLLMSEELLKLLPEPINENLPEVIKPFKAARNMR